MLYEVITNNGISNIGNYFTPIDLKPRGLLAATQLHKEGMRITYTSLRGSVYFPRRAISRILGK